MLLCSERLSDTEVALHISCSHQTVGRTRKRFHELRLDSLADLPRTVSPRKIDDEKVADIIRLTLESKPEGKTHWSTRSMAQKTGISNERVSMIWQAFGLKPHKSETFQISTDPFFVEKVRDVVGLYMSPPQNAMVLSIDEKSQIQASDRVQPSLPLKKGLCDYKRNGTTALNIANGQVIGTLKCPQTLIN